LGISTEWIRYYKDVKISKDRYLDNYLNYKKDKRKRAFSSAGEPVDRQIWTMTAPVIFSILQC
jgi:predicted metalloendopeptidase